MKRQYLLLGSLIIFVVALLIIGPSAYADNEIAQGFQALHADLDQVESQLGIGPAALDESAVLDKTEPCATKADLIEEDFIKKDQIEGIIS